MKLHIHPRRRHDMSTVTFFPRPIYGGENTYINDYIKALEEEGFKVINPAHKNPLLSIVKPSRWGKTIIINWPENIPNAPYGWLQSITYMALILAWRLCGKDIIWMIHNKKSHQGGHDRLKHLLTAWTILVSTCMITHTEEGGDSINERHEWTRDKTYYVPHPTKNRLHLRPAWADDVEPKYDVLIWGQISPYKGVPQFLHYLKDNGVTSLRVLVVGKCSTPELQHDIEGLQAPWLTYRCERASFEELANYAAQAKYVLCPYLPETVLSSAIMMDSLSWGSKVIGPNTGCFHDFSYRFHDSVKVYTFNDIAEIPQVVKENEDEPISLEEYADFLNGWSWDSFAERLSDILSTSEIC